MGKKQEKDLRIVQSVVDSVIAERDAEIAALRQQVAELENALSKREAQQATMWKVIRDMAGAYHEKRKANDLQFAAFMAELDKARD